MLRINRYIIFSQSKYGSEGETVAIKALTPKLSERRLLRTCLPPPFSQRSHSPSRSYCRYFLQTLNPFNRVKNTILFTTLDLIIGYRSLHPIYTILDRYNFDVVELTRLNVERIQNFNFTANPQKNLNCTLSSHSCFGF